MDWACSMLRMISKFYRILVEIMLEKENFGEGLVQERKNITLHLREDRGIHSEMGPK
jgi:hypothetical protein